MQLHDVNDTLRFGAPLAKAVGAVILIHGRGSSAGDVAPLGETLKNEALSFLAPNAVDGTWYPQRFFVPLVRNEPWLSSAIGVIDQLLREIRAVGIPFERIGLIGFSQGACLTLEYAARYPQRYGFVAGLSGGLIGPLDTPRPAADMERTPVLVGCAESDPHIPLEFVEKSTATFSKLNADVTKQIFRGNAHTVFSEEIAWLRQRVLNWK
jgi:phospholipase/carboxylesterase